MYAYCVNNPVNWVDYSGTVPAVAAAIPAGIGLVLFCAAVAVISSKDLQDVWADTTEDIMDGIETIGDAINSLFDKPTPEEVPDTSPDQGEVSEIPDVPSVPDVAYPGDDPLNPPDGFEWKGPGEPGSKQGGYHNQKTNQSLRPDLNHKPPIGPHWDYKGPEGSFGIFPDRIFPK